MRTRSAVSLAAALGSSLITGGNAFVHPVGRGYGSLISKDAALQNTGIGSSIALRKEWNGGYTGPVTLQRPRLHSSLFDDNDPKKKDDGFLTKLADKAKSAAKSILPASWFLDEKTKRAEIEKRERREEIRGGITEMLKDAPLAVRMMGKMITPLMSSLAEELGAQSRAIEDVLEDALTLMAGDARLTDALGQPLRRGPPFSQSSSTVSINGRTQTKIQASFQIQGPYGSAVATVVSSGDGTGANIEALDVNLKGRSYSVDVSGKPSYRSQGQRLGKNANVNKDDVIDVEFVEKNTK